MADSVGAVLLDIFVGKETISSTIKSTMADATKVVSDNSATWNQKLGAVGGAMSGVGAALLPASAAVGAFGVLAGKSALSFEDAMAQVSTIADTTQVPMKDLEKSILDLSNQTGVSAEEIAGNVYNAISAGQSTGDAVNFVSNATKLAKAGFTDSASALDLLTTTLNAYGMESEEVTKVSDLLMNTQNLGKTTINELAGSMGKIIPTAKAYGTGLDQITTGYAIMTSNGIATAESTTYMNSLLNELGKTGTKSADILQAKTGKSFTDLMNEGASLGDVLQIVNDAANEQGVQFGDLFGSAEAAKAGLTLLGDGAENFNSILGEMQGTTGTTDDAFEKMDTTSNKMNVAWNQIKNTAITLGTTLITALMPMIEAVVGAISSFCEWFQNADGFTQGLIIAIGALVLIVPPLLIGIGNLLMIIAGLPAAFAACSAGAGILAGAFTAISWPVVAIIAGIVALIAAGYLLWKNWDKVSEWCVNAWNGFKDSVLAIGDSIGKFFTETIPNAFNSVVEFFANNWQTILGFIINPLGTAFSWCYNNLDGFRDFVDNFVQGVKDFFINGFNAIGNFFTETIPQWIENIGNWFNELPAKIGYAIGNVLGSIVKWGADCRTWFDTNIPIWIETVTTYFSELPGKIWAKLVDVYNRVVQWGSDMWAKVTEVVTTFISKAVTVISELPGKIWAWLVNTYNKVVQWGSDLWAKATNIASTFVNNVISFVQNLPSRIWNYLTDIISKVTTWGSNMWSKGSEIASTFVSNLVNKISELPGKMMSIGGDIVKGIWNGISNMGGWIWDKIGGFAGGIVDGFKNALGIHSPSRVMADEVGVHTGDGMFMGLQDSLNSGIGGAKKLVKDSFETLASMPIQGPQLAMAGGPAPQQGSGTTTTTTDDMLKKFIELLEKFDSNNNGGGDVTIPVYLDGSVLDEVIVSASDRKNLRSGGR